MFLFWKGDEAVARLGGRLAFAAVLAAGVCSASLAAEEVNPAAAAPEDSCHMDGGLPSAAVAVHVTDASGAVLEHAVVDLVCGASVHHGLTDRSGDVSLQVRPGSYHLSVKAPGFAPSQQLAVLPAAQPITVALKIGAASDVVNVNGDTGIVADTTTFGSKNEVALVELPQTVNVVTEREIAIRNAQTVNEILRYTPGIETDEYGFEPRQDWMKIRGFTADTYGMFRDGMRWNSLAGKVDPYELQSVEVVKGPASVLYGQAPPGGLVNLTTKRPGAERRGEFQGQFGSYDRRQGQLDFTGSFDSNQKYRYRLLGLVRQSGTQVQYVPDSRRLIAPELSWNPGERTSFVLLGDWQHDTTKWGPSLPASGTLYSNPNGYLSPSLFVGEPAVDKVTREQASIGYLADHRFTDGWQLHQNYRYQYSNFQGGTTYVTGFEPGSSSLATRSYFTYPQHTYIHTLDSRALRRFDSVNWQQTVLAGFDFSDMAQRTAGTFGTASDINLYRPVYTGSVPTAPAYLNNFTDMPQYGVYLQDQIRYRNHVAITLGGREDWAISDATDFLSTPNQYQHQNNSKFTGRVGVAYLTGIGINPYYSFSTSFQPTGGTDFFGKLFKPTYGKQHEVGVKIQPHTWNSFITASYFNIDQDNVLTTDPAPTHPFFSVQGGAVRSRGLELEAVTQLHRGVSLHAGYGLVATSYTKASSADAATIGKWFPQVPRNTFSLLTDYAVPSGKLAGLGGNFGVRFTGLSYGDNLNSLAIPNYTLLDASVRFTVRHTTFQVNATNLTDATYIQTCTSLTYCNFGIKRNVIGTAKYSF